MQRIAERIWGDARLAATSAEDRMVSEKHVRYIADVLEREAERRGAARAKSLAKKIVDAEKDELRAKVNQQSQQLKAKSVLLQHAKEKLKAKHGINLDDIGTSGPASS